ncbi:MAG: hypothetical protein ISR99_02170 [Parcubacteria group bacterium]|nr:hypothetical protein [Parcubacteria group bacterium]
MIKVRIKALKQVKKKTFWTLVGLVVFLMGAYSYFLGKSIVNVVVREEVEQEIALVNSAISELEFAYLEKKDTVNRALASELGYVFVPQDKFVVKKTLTGKHLTQNNAI